MMQKTIFTLALFMLTSGCVAQAQEVGSRRLPIRKDHPRILFNKDQLPAIRAKCAGPFAKEYAQMKAQADERVDEILAEGFVQRALAEQDRVKAGKIWEGLEAIGLLWHVTGEERYAQAGRRLHELLMTMSEETIAGVAALDRRQMVQGKQLLDRTGPLYLSYGLFYDYVCMDGTKCYSENKLNSFTRQFVYLKPNIFVVFDRVVSTKADFRKRWHLHFYNEPRIDGSLVYADHEGGRLYCQTLLPAHAKLKKVQGAELEQTDGTYVSPEGWTDSPTDTWRLDVGPDKLRTNDVFLHVLQAVDTGQPRTFVSREFERDGTVGVEVTVGGRAFGVLFARDGEASGHILVREGEEVLADRDFPQRIEDTYALWKDDPRFKNWMTDSRFKYVIPKEDVEMFRQK